MQHNILHSVFRLVYACHMWSVRCCSRLWRGQSTVGWIVNSDVLWWLPVELHSAGLWTQVIQVNIMPSCCHHGCMFWTVKTYTPSFYTLAVLFLFLLHKGAGTRPVAGLMPKQVSRYLFQNLETVLGDTVNLIATAYIDVYHLCNLIRQQVLSHATSTEKTKISKHKT